MKTFLIALAGCCFALTLDVGAQEDVRVHFPQASVADVLAFYGELTGKKIVCDNTVQGQISVEAAGALSKEKAALLVGRALSANGFTLVDASDDTVLVLGLGKPARSAGLRLYTKPEELPREELVCSYLCKIEHRDPQELAVFLERYVPPTNSTGFTADRVSGTLLITHTSGTIRTLLRVVEALDVTPVPSARKAAAEKTGGGVGWPDHPTAELKSGGRAPSPDGWMEPEKLWPPPAPGAPEAGKQTVRRPLQPATPQPLPLAPPVPPPPQLLAPPPLPPAASRAPVE